MLALATPAALAGDSRHAHLHPRDSALYVEVPDVRELLAAYPSAPAARMAGDPEVRAAWAKISAALNVDLGAGFGRVAAGLGLTVGAVPDTLDEVTAALARVDVLSISTGLAEARPGELADALTRIRDAAREVAEVDARLRRLVSAPQATYPSDLTALDLGAELATDPWGRPWVYESIDGGASYRLLTLGSDGAAGGEGEAADFQPVPRGEASDVSPSVADVVAAELSGRTAILAVVDFEDALAAREFRAWLEASLPAEAPDDTSASITGLRRFGRGWTLELAGASRVAIGFGAADPRDVARRAADPSASPGPLESTRLDSQVGTPTGVPVALGRMRASAWLDAIQSSGGDSAIATLLGFLPSGWIADTTWRMQLAGDRFVTDIVVADGATETGQAGWLRAIGRTRVAAESARFVPDDAIAAALFTLDAGALNEQVAQALGVTADSNPLAGLEEKHGFRLKEDLFGALGGGCAVYVLQIQSLSPAMAVILDLDDAPAFERGVTGLMKALDERPDAPFHPKFKRYRETPMWTLAFEEGEQPIALPMLTLSPTLAIAHDRAIVTLTSTRAIKEIKRALGEDGAAHPLAARMQELPGDATLVGQIDWAALFDGAYTSARAALTLFAGQAEMPFDAAALSAALPEPKVFSRFFQPTLAWTRPVAGGTQAHVESSFGPETWLGLAVIAGAAVDAVEHPATREPEVVEAPPPPAPDLAATDATKAVLHKVATRLAVFRIETGRYPSELKELLVPTSSYPRGFLDSTELPADGWGRALRYDAPADGSAYRLWSLGSNGVDDAAAGDDVVAP